MAYYRDLQTACWAGGCVKWAVTEVFGKDGMSKGYYCRECCRRTILRLNREEEQRDKEEKNARRKSVSRR
jgi:hypothetical protein